LAVGLLFLYLAFLKGHLESIDGLLMYRQSTSLVAHDGGLALLVIPLALFAVAVWGFTLGVRSKV